MRTRRTIVTQSVRIVANKANITVKTAISVKIAMYRIPKTI